ncbi:unnamed protein product [Lymnaea stagnalis]|uniref:SAM domain-containing protein n=1 Tax=Lymnaea stagnalis TaxID=6523 RepID=A0AAV2HX88_LYMST
MASMSETSYWINFFTTAGIPAGDAAHYAVMFSDNRITREMLLDLSKEYLTDMGITRLGDIIAILKHAKDVFKQEAKDKILKSTSLTSLSSASSQSISPALRRSTGGISGLMLLPSVEVEGETRARGLKKLSASRMVNHFTSKHPEAAPMSQSPVPKLPPPDPPRSKRKVSVFDRLGDDGVDDTVTLTTSSKLAALQASTQSSVFSRLGGKAGLKRSASESASLENLDDLLGADEESLPYAGVLKGTGPSPAKKANIKVAVNRSSLKEPFKIKKTFKSVTVTEEKKTSHIQRPEVSTTTEGVLSDFAKRESPSVKERLGSKAQQSSVTSTSIPKVAVTQKQKTKLTVQDRLGAKVEEQQSSPVVSSTQRITPKLKKKDTAKSTPVTSAPNPSGVFSRLGKKAPT